MDCLFCGIVAGDVPSRQVYADEHAIAFLDIAPFHRGHTLVVPRRHADDLLAGEQQLTAIAPAVDATARLLQRRLSPAGMNLFSSAGAVAGQEVPHLHVHLVPRYEQSAGLRNLFVRDEAAADDADEVHRLLTTE